MLCVLSDVPPSLISAAKVTVYFFIMFFCGRVFYRGDVYASKSSAEKLLMLLSIDKNTGNRILIQKKFQISIKGNVMLHKKIHQTHVLVHIIILKSSRTIFNLSHSFFFIYILVYSI